MASGLDQRENLYGNARVKASHGAINAARREPDYFMKMPKFLPLLVLLSLLGITAFAAEPVKIDDLKWYTPDRDFQPRWKIRCCLLRRRYIADYSKQQG